MLERVEEQINRKAKRFEQIHREEDSDSSVEGEKSEEKLEDKEDGYKGGA